MRTLFTITFLAIFGLIQLPAQAWIQKQSLPASARFGSMSFAVNGKGYVACGQEGSTYFDDLWEYDPTQDTWTQKANYPNNPLRQGVSFAIDSLGYVCAGWDGVFGYQHFYSYNPASDTWTPLSFYPGFMVYNMMGASLDGIGYVGGGSTIPSQFFTDTFYAYDPVTDQWTQKSNLPFGERGEGVAYGVDGLVFFGLGWDGTTAYNDFWAYNPAANAWARRSNFPGVERINATIVEADGKLIVGGGYQIQIGTELPDYYEYDPATDIWTTFPGFSAGDRSFSAGFTIGQTPYLTTGRDNMNVPIADLWAFDVNGVGVDDELEQINVTLFPNPTTGKLTLKYGLKQGVGEFSLFDTMGREILTQAVRGSVKETEIDLTAYPTGLYTYRLVAEAGTATGNVVLTR